PRLIDRQVRGDGAVLAQVLAHHVLAGDVLAGGEARRGHGVFFSPPNGSDFLPSPFSAEGSGGGGGAGASDWMAARMAPSASVASSSATKPRPSSTTSALRAELKTRSGPFFGPRPAPSTW